jgi:PAS domain S-box-containing protein
VGSEPAARSEPGAEERRRRLLADASGMLARSLEFGETLATVARLAVPAFADWCFVELLRPDGGISRVVIEHADPSKRDFIEEYDRRYPIDPNAPVGSARVVRTGEPELMSEIPDAFWDMVAADPEQHRLLRGVGLRSSMVVPLRVRGVVIGDIALATAESGRSYDEADLRMAQELADRCALALDNARLYTELLEADAASRRSRDELEAILEGVADAVTAQTPEGRLVYANHAAVRLLGYTTAEELLAAAPGEIRERFDMRDDDGSPLPVERLPGRLALMGERPEPLTVRYRRAGESHLRWSRVQARPLFDEAGAVRLAINVIEDITDIKRAEHGQRLLAEASRALVGSHDHRRALQAVAGLAVGALADWCAIDLDGERVATAPAEEEIDPSAVDAGFTLQVPLQARDRMLGTLTLVSTEGRRFDEHDRALAQDLALRAATAVESARLYETRSAIAHTLQTSLLPPVLPELPGLELAAAYRPAGEGHEVGGDFYDVFSTAEDEWYAVVGDVCGKGAAAAAVTALARYTIRAAAVRRRSPSAILRWLSDAMIQQSEGAGRFCTIACVHLDLSRAPVRATVSCGGHPLPIVLRAAGGYEEVGVPGTLLGLVAGPRLEDRETELAAGDTLVLYTDGLTEGGAPERVVEPAELAAAATGNGSVGGAVDRLVAAAIGELAAPRDDVAVLALRAAAHRAI